MNIPALIGTLVTVGLLLTGIMLGAPLVIFIDVTSVLIVVGGTVFLTLAAHGPDGIIKYIVGGLARLFITDLNLSAPWSALECQKAVLVARTAGTSAIMMAVCGAMIGLTQMFTNLDDPTHIGPAMAVCLLTSFYGVLLNLFVFIPLARYHTDAACDAEGAAQGA